MFTGYLHTVSVCSLIIFTQHAHLLSSHSISVFTKNFHAVSVSSLIFFSEFPQGFQWLTSHSLSSIIGLSLHCFSVFTYKLETASVSWLIISRRLSVFIRLPQTAFVCSLVIFRKKALVCSLVITTKPYYVHWFSSLSLSVFTGYLHTSTVSWLINLFSTTIFSRIR